MLSKHPKGDDISTELDHGKWHILMRFDGIDGVKYHNY